MQRQLAALQPALPRSEETYPSRIPDPAQTLITANCHHPAPKSLPPATHPPNPPHSEETHPNRPPNPPQTLITNSCQHQALNPQYRRRLGSTRFILAKSLRNQAKTSRSRRRPRLSQKHRPVPHHQGEASD